MEPETQQDEVAAEAPPSGPPRIPPMGAGGHGTLAPMHLSQFAIEQNVSRIGAQIATGRPPTYD